jgi:hypothetical protein
LIFLGPNIPKTGKICQMTADCTKRDFRFENHLATLAETIAVDHADAPGHLLTRVTRLGEISPIGRLFKLGFLSAIKIAVGGGGFVTRSLIFIFIFILKLDVPFSAPLVRVQEGHPLPVPPAERPLDRRLRLEVHDAGFLSEKFPNCTSETR